MKLEERRNPRLKVLHWLERCLWIIGSGVLSYFIFTLSNTMIFQERSSRAFDRVRATPAPVHLQPTAHAVSTHAASNAAVRDGSLVLGRLKIARVSISAMVLDGTEAATLRTGLGHVLGTSKPGELGNTVIAGHRDTFFRPLRRIQSGDAITFETLYGTYHYRVTSVEVVDPQDLAVLQSHEKPELTLLTCFPFSYFGHAPKRFIVHAVLVS